MNRESSPPRHKLALDYSKGQFEILHGALAPIEALQKTILSTSTIPTTPRESSTMLQSGLEILSLESAYAWLEHEYPILGRTIIQLISEDQEEPIPLKWAELIPDWSRTYWVVWLSLIWSICLKDPRRFGERHRVLFRWLAAIKA